MGFQKCMTRRLALKVVRGDHASGPYVSSEGWGQEGRVGRLEVKLEAGF